VAGEVWGPSGKDAGPNEYLRYSEVRGRRQAVIQDRQTWW
jgi:hypothetical protein